MRVSLGGVQETWKSLDEKLGIAAQEAPVELESGLQ